MKPFILAALLWATSVSPQANLGKVFEVTGPSWAILGTGLFCNNANWEMHRTHATYSADICRWEKEKTTLIFITYGGDVRCQAIIKGKYAECPETWLEDPMSAL